MSSITLRFWHVPPHLATWPNIHDKINCRGSDKMGEIIYVYDHCVNSSGSLPEAYLRSTTRGQWRRRRRREGRYFHWRWHRLNKDDGISANKWCTCLHAETMEWGFSSLLGKMTFLLERKLALTKTWDLCLFLAAMLKLRCADVASGVQMQKGYEAGQNGEVVMRRSGRIGDVCSDNG